MNYSRLRVLSTLVAKEWKSTTMLTSQFVMAPTMIGPCISVTEKFRNFLWMLLDYLEK